MAKQKQPIELPTFETIEQLMADAYLHKCITKQIKYFNTERTRVSENGKKKLKASPIDYLIQNKLFTAEALSTQHIDIHYKRSTLPSSVREFIGYLMTECLGDTFNHYESLFQKQNNKTSKLKKS